MMRAKFNIYSHSIYIIRYSDRTVKKVYTR